VSLFNANMTDYACTLRHMRQSPFGIVRCVASAWLWGAN